MRLLKIIIALLFIFWITSSIFLYFSWFNFELFFQNLNLNIYYKIIIILLIYTFRNYLLVPSTVIILFSWFFLQNFLLSLIVNIIWVGIGILQTYFVGYIFWEDLHKNKLFNKVSKYKDKIQNNWFKVIFLWAFFPVITVDVFYYTAWIIKYSVTKCFLAWLLWEMPLIILYSYLWKEASKYSDYFLYIAIILIIAYILYYYIKKYLKDNNRNKSIKSNIHIK